jgi:TRAP-type C4-dicarboxylate transport system permease small subunit
MIRCFDRACAIFASLILVALLITVLLGVITRAVDDPLVWTDELSRTLMVWLAGFGWIIGTRKRGHVRIRFFQDLLPTRLRHAAEAAIQLGMAGLGLIVFCSGFGLVARNRELEALTLPISAAWLYVPLIPAGLVTALQAAAELRAALAGLVAA